MNGYKLFYCRSNDAGRRLDRVVKKMLPDVPAGLIYSSIRKGLIKVNGKKSSQSYRLEEEDVIEVRESIKHSAQSKSSAPGSGREIKSRNAINNMTVLRTDNLILLNKPAGMLTHGEDSLAELLKDGLTGVEDSLSFTPAPLHRLDRNTSGLIAVSLTIKGASRFSELMRGHDIRKYYLGLCAGSSGTGMLKPGTEIRLEDRLVRSGNKSRTGSARDSDEGLGEGSLEGRQALTFMRPLASEGRFSFCLFRIETGLTHQIRAQAAAAGFPLAGDVKYGGRAEGFRVYYLHSFAMLLPEHDELCGFKNSTAEPAVSFTKKASAIFGKNRVAELIEAIKTEIIS